MAAEMNAAVSLRLEDELSRPAKRAAESVRALARDMEKLRKLSGGSSGLNRHLEGVVRQVKEAQKAARGLRETISRPVPDGFRRAVTGIERVRSEAVKATRAVSDLESRLRRGGSFGGRVAGGGNRQGGGGGHRGGFGSHAAGHFGRHVVRHALGTGLGLGAYAIGSEIAEGIAESVKAGMEQSFEKQHTVAMLRMQGEKMGDINAAIAQANKMASVLPSFTSAQHLESIAELRPALTGGLKEATRIAPMFQRSVAILEAVKQGAGAKALSGVNTHGEALDLVRALEIKGETSHTRDRGWTEAQNDQNMERYVDGMTKAIVGMNGQINAKDFHSAFKGSSGISNVWSQEFATEILPTIMNELKKSKAADSYRAGNAFMSMSRAVVDNVMTPQAMNNWDALGMYALGTLKTGKGGKKTVVPNGHMLGYDVFQSNPYQFMQDYLLPHMKEHGIDIGNRKQVVAALGGLFGNRVANAIATILATQQAQIQKDQDNIRKATGTSGLDFLMNADPTMRMHVFAASLKELGGSIGDLALPGNMRGMKGIIDWAHRMSDAVHGSAYGKSLGGYYESMIAGMFGQRLGRKGLNGRNGEYYAAGRELGQGWSKFTSAVGKLAQFAEEMGAVTASMRVFGGFFDEAGKEIDGDVKLVKGALGSDFAKRVRADFENYSKQFGDATAVLSAHFTEAMDAFPAQLKAAGQSIVDALNSVEAWIEKELAWTGMFNKKADAAEKKNGGASASWDDPAFPKPAALSGGFNPKAIFDPAPIAAAAGASTPEFSAAGASAIAALAGGLSAGAGPATASMSALMGNLAGIAAAGVTVPVNLDTAGAEAKLSALMSKANSLAKMKPGSDGRYSGFQNDLGQ